MYIVTSYGLIIHHTYTVSKSGPLRLPVPGLELTSLPAGYTPIAMPETIDPEMRFCQQVVFEIQMGKVAAVLFPEDPFILLWLGARCCQPFPVFFFGLPSFGSSSSLKHWKPDYHLLMLCRTCFSHPTCHFSFFRLTCHTALIPPCYWCTLQDGSGGTPMENRQAKAAMEKKHLLSSKMQSLTKLGLLKSLGKILHAYVYIII